MPPMAEQVLPGWVVVFTVEAAGHGHGPSVFHPERIVQGSIQELDRERFLGAEVRVFTFDYPAEDGKSYRHTIKLEAPKTLDELIDAARVELARGNYYEIPGKS